MRIERYDANQQVLKDPYSLLPIQTIGEVTSLNGRNIDHPDNLGDDYAVYVNNAKNPTSILGYRKDNIWYNKDGVEIPNPEILAQQTINNFRYRLACNGAGVSIDVSSNSVAIFGN